MGKLIDLTGQRFGKLIVIKRVENAKDKTPQWLCKCDCGNEKIVSGGHLRSGHTKSCGCRNMINEIGNTYGYLTVIAHVEGKDAQWLCKCKCGNNTIVKGTVLRSGHVRSCGCLARENLALQGENRLINEIGNKYGYLTVIERANNANSGHARWKCRCECGNITIVDGAHLRNGSIKSCGCEQGKKINLIGKKFGKLTVIENAPSDKFGRARWKCRCECGNEKIIMAESLMSGHTKSCGCLERGIKPKILILDGNIYGKLTVINSVSVDTHGNKRKKCICECGKEVIVRETQLRYNRKMSCGCQNRSNGEIKVAQILKENNISFIEQYRPFKFLSGHYASFDFYINNHYFIEYDGIQHYTYKTNGWNTKENHEGTKIRDEIKNQWCKDNNIPLIRIPYWHLQDLTIDDLRLETSQFIIK